MIPLRDDLPGGGTPAVTYLLALGLLIWSLAAGDGFWLGLLAGLGAWIWSPALTRRVGPAPAALVAAIGAAAGWLLANAGQQSEWAIAAAPVALALVHLLLHPKARVLGLVLVPFRSFVTAVPSLAVAAVWTPLICLLAKGA